MRMRWCTLVPMALISVLLPGCGSQSYEASMRSAIADMQSVIATYNKVAPADLAATGSACASAFEGLKGQQQTFEQTSPPARYRAESSALKHAYALGKSGFSDCARAARTLSYPLMFRADREIAAANSWIQSARRLDR